jgi:predicted transcriptional regulator
MKVKKIKVRIRSLDSALDEFVSVAKKIESGQKVKPKKVATYVADAETARAIFTESRLKLIKLLKKESPSSIYELAKLLERDFKNVYEDVVFLSELGIIGIKESKTGRRQKKPTLLCDNIQFDLAA